MAESFVSGIAVNLVGKIASLVRDEVALAWGLETDVNALRESLTTVKDVLLDAEEKQAQNHELRGWLRKLKNFCYDAEDVLEELEYEDSRKKVLKQYGNPNNMVSRFISSSKFRLKMGHKVKKLRQRLDEIANLRLKFQLSQRGGFVQAGRGSREMTDSHLSMSNVVGRNGDKEKILEFLLHQKKPLSVIPIVGLGGMGKTTLAKLLYNDKCVKEHFDPRIWVCVSDEFEKKQIMVSIIKSLTDEDHSDLDPDQLQKRIPDQLNSKKFLLVLDDVWSDDRIKWIEFRELLEGGAAGSQVIVTARNISVADTVRTTESYHLEGLPHEQCVSLFKKFAFREGEEESNQHLMEIGDDIVKKCGGIPLAVKTMGALLFNQSNVRYWECIRDSETWKLKLNEGQILPALKLSYDQLPSYLKPCFAICSLYPKDYLIPRDELIRIWMANGLLQSSNERDMEDIGVQYIEELNSRSFLGDFEKDGLDIRFRIHDLVHDLACLISQNECFFVDTCIEKVPDEIQYLAIYQENSLKREVPGILKEKRNLRTIVYPTFERLFSSRFIVNTSWMSWASSSKRMRMLDFSFFKLQVLSSSIGGLKLLRSLDLRFNDIETLPGFIWKLHNLLYLDLTNCSSLEQLPSDIRNLIKLRELRITRRQKRLPDDGIGCLSSLRHLHIYGSSNLEYLFEDIHRLTSLRTLEVIFCHKLISFPLNLIYLNALENLVIQNCEQFNWPKEDDIQDIKLRLRYLDLQFLPQVGILPRWLQSSFKTLQRLLVHSCGFSSFPEWLQDYTSLEKLEIRRCQKIVSLPEVHGLTSLKELRIGYCYRLVSLPEGMHCLTSLKELMIICCFSLVSLPEGMHHLTSLKRLTIVTCGTLNKKCKRPGGEDWPKIAHVPNIQIVDSPCVSDIHFDDVVYMITGDSSTV